MDIHHVLLDLNSNQRLAVTTPNNSILQIIAGPGTGKTKVLISRVAYLLLHEQIPPEKIIVTTFTKKAANEMLERLGNLLGETVDISKLIIGTFHSICFRIIKQYGGRIGLAKFNIANENDSDKVLKEVFKNLSPAEIDLLERDSPEMAVLTTAGSNSEDKYHGLDTKRVKRAISSLKAKGITHEFYKVTSDSNKVLSFLYSNYQERLKANLLLDFDDCLLYCYRLVTGYPVLSFVQHVLIDEFQDTNEIQLQLMYAFATGHPTIKKTQNNVTIVGDPDQSIYSFRDAQSINFEKMKDHYKSVKQITLDENYRSTSDVLNFSELVMRQQKLRVLKSLNSQMQHSFKPVFAKLENSSAEARWIAYQISQLTKLPNEPIDYNGISILVRSSFQTRAVEDELRKARIPYVMVKGKAFWERKEVVAILDYLRVVANKNDRIALLRILNYPKRGIGEKSMAAIEEKLENEDRRETTVFEVFKRIIDEVKLSSKSKIALGTFIDCVEKATEMMLQILDQPSIGQFFNHVYEYSGLKQELKEDPNQDLNVNEVKQQLCEYTPPDDEIWGDGNQVQEDQESPNLISSFIHSIGLYETDPKNKDEADNSRGRVSISTIHGSKGLEWPAVFVPGLIENMLPARFAISSQNEESIDEERRCFYVSTTRAKVLLYLSSYKYYSQYNTSSQCDESRFIKGILNSTTMSQDAFKNDQSMERLYGLLGLPAPKSGDFYKEYVAGLEEFVSDDLESSGYSTPQTSYNASYQNVSYPSHNHAPKAHSKAPSKVAGLAKAAGLSKAPAFANAPAHSKAPTNSVLKAPTNHVILKAPKYEIHRKRETPLIPLVVKKFKPFTAPRFVDQTAASTAAPTVKLAPTYIPDRKRK